MLTTDQLTDLRHYVMNCNDLGSFVLFLVDRHVESQSFNQSDVIKNLLSDLNQPKLYSRPKVTFVLFITVYCTCYFVISDAVESHM